MKTVPSLILGLCVAACGAIVPETAMRLAANSPLEADPSAIAVALLLPNGLAVRDGGAKLELTAKGIGPTEGFKGAYTLAETPVDAAGFGADPDKDAGATARFYTITPADAAEMRKAQAALKEQGRAGTRRKGLASIGIGLDGCTTGQGPAPDARVSIYIRTEAKGAFYPLIDKANLSQLLGPVLMAQLKPCAGPR
jgi:hypothetical protein